MYVSSSLLPPFENSMAKIKTNGNQFCCYLKVPWEVKINFMIEFFVLATDFCGAFLCRNKLCFPSRQVSPTLTFVFLLIGKPITNRYFVSGICFILSHSMREIRKSSSWLLKKLNFKANVYNNGFDTRQLCHILKVSITLSSWNEFYYCFVSLTAGLNLVLLSRTFSRKRVFSNKFLQEEDFKRLSQINRKHCNLHWSHSSAYPRWTEVKSVIYGRIKCYLQTHGKHLSSEQLSLLTDA